MWKSDRLNKIKLVTVMIILSIAILRAILIDELSERIDTTFLNLLIFAVIVYFVPWERIESIKTAAFEASFYKKQVNGAIDGLRLDDNRVANRLLKEMFTQKSSDIEIIRGSRVLWIDDNPHRIIGERRIFRALGVEIITSRSSTDAESVLEADNDFDMIISDISRKGETSRRPDEKTIQHGIDFFMELRGKTDPVLKLLPVIFYTGYKPNVATRITKEVREKRPAPDLSYTIMDLLERSIAILAESRSNPIKVKSKKEPTSPR